MRFLWTISFIALTSSLITATRLENRAGISHYPVTGVHTGINRATGARPARRNILDLQKDEPQWSLYIQALIAMQDAPESDPLSYYQISGIHGRPYTTWDNVGPGVDTPLTGYCTHGSVLFPSWHRPYLALYEQVLAHHVKAIASKYSGPALLVYKVAADNFRTPYWDWALTPQMPAVVNAEKLKVVTPSGVRVVRNPLLQYQFQKFPFDQNYFPSSNDSAKDWYLASYPRTVRNPDADGSGSNFDHANQVLGNANLKDQVYYALTKSADYDGFATEAVWGPSIESVHSVVHLSIGGAWGHMAQLSYAGFDPIFWLHHVNVDRLTALYQAMHPDSYLTPFPDHYGSYTLPGGGDHNDTLSTPLEPFFTDTEGRFYTSSMVQSLKEFGYSYPEIQDWNQTPQELQAKVITQVNHLYGPSAAKIKRRGSGPPAATKVWSVRIHVSKFDLGGQRFIVRIFLGDVPQNPLSWSTSETCLGSFPVFPPVQSTEIHPQIPTHNEISLTAGLKARGYDGQDSTTTAKYLERALHWRVQLVNGTVVSTEDLKSLNIQVHEGSVDWGDRISELPSYGEGTPRPRITRAKTGGGY